MSNEDYIPDHMMLIFSFNDFSPHTRQKAIVSSTDDFMKIVDPNDFPCRDPFAVAVVVRISLCVCLCICNLIFRNYSENIKS